MVTPSSSRRTTARLPPEAETTRSGRHARYHRGDRAGALEAGIGLTPAIDPTYTRTRFVEALAWVHALEGRVDDVLQAIEASVVAQGLPPEVAARVVRIGRGAAAAELAKLAPP